MPNQAANDIRRLLGCTAARQQIRLGAWISAVIIRLTDCQLEYLSLISHAVREAALTTGLQLSTEHSLRVQRLLLRFFHHLQLTGPYVCAVSLMPLRLQVRRHVCVLADFLDPVFCTLLHPHDVDRALRYGFNV